MVATTMIFVYQIPSRVGNFFLSRKILSRFAFLSKSCFALTVSRDLACLQNVRGWETFYQSGKLLSDFEKVSHPQIPCGSKAESHRWETGKLSFKIIFERHTNYIY